MVSWRILIVKLFQCFALPAHWSHMTSTWKLFLVHLSIFYDFAPLPCLLMNALPFWFWYLLLLLGLLRFLTYRTLAKHTFTSIIYCISSAVLAVEGKDNCIYLIWTLQTEDSWNGRDAHAFKPMEFEPRCSSTDAAGRSGERELEDLLWTRWMQHKFFLFFLN